MYKIIFSIPVHEKPEVIIDQVINILHFNPDCAVVLHLSAGFINDGSMTIEELQEKLNTIDGVFVNPVRNSTAWGNIIKAHLSNYEYAQSVCDYEYFAIAASNELFFREGAYDYISKYDFVVQQLPALREKEVWANAKHALEDNTLKGMLLAAGSTDDNWQESAFGGQCEGSYYRKEIYGQIAEYINKYYDFNTEPDVIYSREEIYPPTLAKALYPDAKGIDSNTCFVPWGKRALRTFIKDIRAYRKGGHFYSLKRVDRELYEPKRVYIRQRLGRYLAQEQALIEVKRDYKYRVNDLIKYIHYLTSII